MTSEGPLPADTRLRALMAEYQGGSIEAFREVYAQLAPAVRRYLAYLTRRGDLTDDLVQETFLQMHRARSTYNPAFAVAPWVFGLARYVYLMHRRSARRFAAVHDGGVEPPEVPVPPEVEHLASADAVRRAITGLSPDQAEPWLLHHQWGFSFDEVAGMLGISAAAARARSSRAMADLRQRLAQEGFP